MRSGRKYALGFFIALFFVAVMALYGISNLSAAEYEEFGGASEKLVRLKVGETASLGLADEEYHIIRMRGDADGVFLDENGDLHANKAGRYEFSLTNNPRYAGEGDLNSVVIGRYIVVAEDSDYSDYTPVYSMEEIGKTGKYILAQSFETGAEHIVDREDDAFNGIIVNPHGYTVTLSGEQPLFYELGPSAIVSGLNIRFKDGVFRPETLAQEVHGSVGPIACLNGGTVADCAVEGTLVAENGNLSGVVGWNGDGGLVCASSFTGEMFCSPDANFGGGIAGSGGYIYDCTVRGDAYAGAERNVKDLRTLYCRTFGQTADYACGNRVYNYDGTVEVDFNSLVEVEVTQEGENGSVKEVVFAGSVLPRDGGLFSDDTLGVCGVEDSYSGERPCDAPYYVPSAEKVSVHYTFRYLQTKVYEESDGRIYRIDAAESAVRLPEGSVLPGDLMLGEYSAENVTLVLAKDTVIEEDLGGISVAELDFSGSDIYEQEGKNVFKQDGESCLLVRCGEEAQDGCVTVPDRATRIGGDPFGDMEVVALDTNKAESIYTSNTAMRAAWRKKLKTLHFGTAFDLQAYSAEKQGFTQLTRYETGKRSDGYFATAGGHLALEREGETRLVAVPPVQPELYGDRIRLEGYDVIAGNALCNNRAQTIVLAGVGRAEANAFYDCSAKTICVEGDTVFEPTALRRCPMLQEVIVSGAAVFENGSVSDCPSLRSLRGEGQSSAITLKSRAISQCGNLETVLLDGAFASVAYDAVVQAKRFKGFTLVDGCDAFDVRGGVLLVENKAYIQEGMGEALLPFGGGQLGSLRIDGDPASSAWLLFADPNVNVSVEGGLKNVRALYAGSEETYFSCGASIEGAEIYYFSPQKPETEGNYWHYGEDGSAEIWE